MLDENDVDHTVKLEVCKFLAIIGQRLYEHRQSFIGLSPDFVIRKIQSLTTDRVVKVQMAAREALRVWKKLEQALEEIERMKMRVRFDVKDPDQLIDMKLNQVENPSPRDGEDSFAGDQSKPQVKFPPRYAGNKPIDRSRAAKKSSSPMANARKERNADDSLEAKSHSTNQNSIARGAEVFKSNNLVEKTHLKHRAHNFQKKRTGTGGGFITEFDEQEKNRKKSSFNQMREQFRSQVMQDRLNYSRKNTRSKYQNHFDGSHYNEENDGYDIEDQVVPVKESNVIDSRPNNSPIEPVISKPPEVPVCLKQETLIQPPRSMPIKESTQPGFPSNPNVAVCQKSPEFHAPPPIPPQLAPNTEDGRGSQNEDDYYEGEEEVYEDDDEDHYHHHAVPFEHAQPEEGLQDEPTFNNRPRFHRDASNPSMAGSTNDKTVKYDSDEEDPRNTLMTDSQATFDGNRGPAPISMASTQYFGNHLDSSSKLGDTTYFYGNPYQRDDRTERCDSESEDSIEDTRRTGPIPPTSELIQMRSSGRNFEFDELVMSWNQALLLLEQNLVNEAYKLILSKEDDLYLIRLMNKTGPCYQQLEPRVAAGLRARAKTIGKTNFVSNLLSQFLGDGPDYLADTINVEKKNPYIDQSSQPNNSGKYMRIEEYPNPFERISQGKTSQFASNPLSQSFEKPVPPQSEYLQGESIQTAIQPPISEPARTSPHIIEEQRKKQQLEQLRKEAAEAYDVLRRQL